MHTVEALPIAVTGVTPWEVISVRQLWAYYGREVVLENIHLSVKERDFVGIIGPNGGGKTTFLKVLLGLHPIASGEVKILGQSVQQGRRAIGYVPQLLDYDRAFPITVWDVVALGRLGKASLFRPYSPRDKEIIAEVLEQVDLYPLRHRAIGQLSGGQRQRAYIARALATEPQILILDEPTASIDPQIRTHIYQLLETLNQTLTIMMISHDVGAIARYVKSIGCLNRRLYYHHNKAITPEMLEEVYHCPVDLLTGIEES